MPVTPTYPGVYIEEVPSGVRTIVGVATSITAFLGRAARGPVNEPVSINSFGDFERKFGGLWALAPMGYAVRDFYLNQGSQAVIVRLYRPFFATDADRDAALAAALAVADAGAEADATAAAQAVADAAEASPATMAEDVAAAARAEADKDDNKDEPRRSAAGTVASMAEEAAGQDGATPDDVKQAARDAVEWAAAQGVAASAREEAEKPANEDEPRRSAADLVAGAAEKAAGRADATAAKVKAAAAQAVGEAAPITRARLSVDTLSLEAANEGTWGNQLRARVDYDVKDDPDAILFNLSVKEGSAGPGEVFRNVSVQAGHPRQLTRVLEQQSQLVRVRGALPDARPGESDDPDPGTDPFGPDSSSGVEPDGMASDGHALENADYIGIGFETGKKGLFALEKADLFNLLCIPPFSPDDDVDKSLWSAAAAYCEKRRAMLLVDAPRAWATKDAAKAGLDNDIGLAHKNAALFFPRLRQPDPKRDGQVEEFAPCGAVAGVFARTDAQRGVWKAPAGLDATLVGVPELSVPLTDPENGELNPLGINCLRSLPAAGRVVWGARTLRGADRLADEWKYVPVRRLALFIEESLYRGTQWVVFEPNDEPLWAQIRLNLGAFMQNLFRQGAFQGRSPREAYFVKCDRETTTQNDINLGIVNVVVGFAPLKPAEFVIIKIQQIAGQVQA
jgi:phage tail sheath protein FI